jgi:hypothetical protein
MIRVKEMLKEIIKVAKIMGMGLVLLLSLNPSLLETFSKLPPMTSIPRRIK